MIEMIIEISMACGLPFQEGQFLKHFLVNFYGTYERGLVIIDITMACDLLFWPAVFVYYSAFTSTVYKKAGALSSALIGTWTTKHIV